jgi:hypothetical protein
MRNRFAIVVALALLGCSPIRGEPVEIWYRSDPFTPACHLNWTDGMLVPHAEAGVAIVENGVQGRNRTMPVLWPEGFTARRVGAVIEILNHDGVLVARTGQQYRFHGGTDEKGWRGCDDVDPR